MNLIDNLIDQLMINRANSKQTVYVDEFIYNLLDETEIRYAGFTFSIKKKVNITEALFKLPSVVHFEGIDFIPKIFKEGAEIRLVYEVLSVDDESPHKQMWDEYGCFESRLTSGNTSFLYLNEGIQSDEDLHEAIEDCYKFLNCNKLIMV